MNQLVERAKTGDQKAEEELFQRLLVRFERFASRMVNAESAAEIAQQACIAILSKYRTEVIETEFDAWAYGVLRMTVKRHFQGESRRAAREVNLPDTVELPERKSEKPILRRHIRECMRSLTQTHTRYARIFNLHQQGFDISEICNRIKLNREQYYVYLGRSRSMLRECLLKKGVAL